MIVQGDWIEARDLARVTRSQGSPLEQHMAVTILGTLAHCQGNVTLAWEMVRELLPRGSASEPGEALFPYAIEMLRLAVKLALDAGDADDARDWLQTHDRWLHWSNAVRGRAESRLLWARLHRLEGDLERAESRAQEALDLAADPRQPLTLLATHRFLGRLALDAGRYEEAEQQLTCARSLADACEAPYERAQTFHLLADLYLQTDRGQNARPLLEEASDIATELEIAPLAATLEDLEGTLETSTIDGLLTPRENEVLRLVAKGMTDARVAEQLHISPRTVGQHLRSVYNKLDVSSRTAATRRAVEDGLV